MKYFQIFQGMLSVGLFARYEPIENTTNGRSGLFHGGGLYLFGIQLLACVVIIAWSAVVSLIILLVSLELKYFVMIETSNCWLSQKHAY